MKVKNILKLRDKLSETTNEVNVAEEGNAPVNVRFDCWEELFYINYDGKEIALSIKEATKLRGQLNKVL